MSKKRKQTNERYDQHVVDALLKLKTPIVGINGIEFSIREKARNETGIEHIAKKEHRLKVRDIESVPEILKHPNLRCSDPDNRVFMNYYGTRKGDNTVNLIKIVTSPVKGKREKEETIITIYPVNTIKLKKNK